MVILIAGDTHTGKTLLAVRKIQISIFFNRSLKDGAYQKWAL